jgi:hypothetical protein
MIARCNKVVAGVVHVLPYCVIAHAIFALTYGHILLGNLSSGAHAIAGLADGGIVVWATADFQPIMSFQAHDAPVSATNKQTK